MKQKEYETADIKLSIPFIYFHIKFIKKRNKKIKIKYRAYHPFLSKTSKVLKNILEILKGVYFIWQLIVKFKGLLPH